MHAPINWLALYVKDMPKIAAFYSKHFGFTAIWSENRDSAMLKPANGGCALLLLQASKGHRIGQSCVKMIFDVADVPAAKAMHAKRGLKFGPIHRGPKYQFTNTRDPAKNLIQLSDAFLVR